MSSTAEAKKSLALAAISNDQIDLSSPDTWIRIRKFKSDNIVFRDFEAKNGIFVARVKEINGAIESVLFMSHTQLSDMHSIETSKSGRPWVDGGSNLDIQEPHEFAFGVAANQLDNNLHLMITPASYFVTHGELWPSEQIDSKLIPAWLNQVTNGIFKSNITDIQELKNKLVDLGFIETDSLSDYHAEIINELAEYSTAGVPF